MSESKCVWERDKTRIPTYLNLDLLRVDEPKLPRRPRFDPRIVEQVVVKRHDRLNPVPLRRARRDAEPAVRLCGGDVRVDEAKAVGGRERHAIEVFTGYRMVRRQAAQEVRVPAKKKAQKFSVKEK